MKRRWRRFLITLQLVLLEFVTHILNWDFQPWHRYRQANLHCVDVHICMHTYIWHASSHSISHTYSSTVTHIHTQTLIPTLCFSLPPLSHALTPDSDQRTIRNHSFRARDCLWHNLLYHCPSWNLFTTGSLHLICCWFAAHWKCISQYSEAALMRDLTGCSL